MSQALKSHDRSIKPLYVSVGHKISLEAAVRLTHSCCRFRIPEPVRQVGGSVRALALPLTPGALSPCGHGHHHPSLGPGPSWLPVCRAASRWQQWPAQRGAQPLPRTKSSLVAPESTSLGVHTLSHPGFPGCRFSGLRPVSWLQEALPPAFLPTCTALSYCPNPEPGVPVLVQRASLCASE